MRYRAGVGPSLCEAPGKMVIFVKGWLDQRLVNTVDHNGRFDNSVDYKLSWTFLPPSVDIGNWNAPSLRLPCTIVVILFLYGTVYLHQHCIQMILQNVEARR